MKFCFRTAQDGGGSGQRRDTLTHTHTHTYSQEHTQREHKHTEERTQKSASTLQKRPTFKRVPDIHGEKSSCVC